MSSSCYCNQCGNFFSPSSPSDVCPKCGHPPPRMKLASSRPFLKRPATSETAPSETAPSQNMYYCDQCASFVPSSNICPNCGNPTLDCRPRKLGLIRQFPKASASSQLNDFQVSESFIQENPNPHCSICKRVYEGGQSASRLQCDHVFHTDCIKDWLKEGDKKLCPKCGGESSTS